MATVLVISSQVVRGYVGGTATRTVLEALGHQAWHIPTVLLSNHPGHPNVAGEPLPPKKMRDLTLALDANRWLADIDAIVVGYLPTPEHVSEAVMTIDIVQAARNDVHIILDPILGDDPGGLYIDEAAASAVRDKLLPLAHLVTPNRFELEWLTGKPVTSMHEALEAAEAHLAKHDTVLLATGIAGDHATEIHDLIIFSDGAFQVEQYRQEATPHGTGDLLTGLTVGHWLNGFDQRVAFARATAGVQKIIEWSRDTDDRPLPRLRHLWAEAHPLRYTPYFPE